ncbi:hypothetical protein Patl1_33041 [Pistacia atlantica]|uniref:Uncharacterized protein n=1 Tax=Pistacia atlantica TaxID=434234 RepID=A0ACC1AMZ6_9ROSI|nr:hypothetical protein Patl1_33041 [Pistacia atlantica]
MGVFLLLCVLKKMVERYMLGLVLSWRSGFGSSTRVSCRCILNSLLH